VKPEPPAFAIVDGALCIVSRRGIRALWHAPLATAVVEFRRGALRWYVREHPFGLLPGLGNLYCLDGALRLLWMADWPEGEGPCVGIVGEENGTLLALAESGAAVRLDAANGRLRSVAAPLAAVG
jgi:hypothetical protein